jgi:general secretion pathway protein D
LVDRIPQLRMLLLPFALGLSACQTIDEAPTSSSWNSAPSVRSSEGQMRPDRTSSAPLLANTRGGQSTVIESSGRFIGEPPTGAIGRPSSEDVTDGITLNLVNVPAPQAAKTVLGDILAVGGLRA